MADRKAMLERIRESFDISRRDAAQIVKNFHVEMKRGLEGRQSSLKMIPTYVDRPTGREKGKFIALDLGGTNFRLLALELKGGGRISVRLIRNFALRKEHITKKGTGLFDLLASSVKAFLKKSGFANSRDINLGFTFSFPIAQSGIASGTLVAWTKGFNAKGVVGKDVVSLLEQALVRNGISHVKVRALANDTVGTLIARSYSDHDCDVGVIIGTGTNACYAEKVKNIKKWEGPAPRTDNMIINIEWGNFNKLKLSCYDRLLDGKSGNPGEQIMEKMVSGMYLGKLCGIVLKDLVEKKYILHFLPRKASSKIAMLRSEDISAIQADKTGSLAGVRNILENIGIRLSSREDRKIIKEVCAIISRRAARICAAAVVSVIRKIDPFILRKHTIAIDGSVYEKYTGFSSNMRSFVKEILGAKACRLRLVLSKDGSGKGAAIIAAVANCEGA
ncbi:MAG: hypothetical protein NC938_03220 [Candidatus Omnitrophica bacterium]|nr:hypothetical protein [Candidatus Omnitrophota bacterium]